MIEKKKNSEKAPKHPAVRDGVRDETPTAVKLDDADTFLKPLGVTPEGKKRKT